MKKVTIVILILFSLAIINAATPKEQFLNDVFYSLNGIVDLFASDYSRIAGIYTAGADFSGSASISNFPSFRIGATIGTIFFTNPLNFLKKINFLSITWSDAKDNLKGSELLNAVNFFENDFIPIPVSYYNFDIGLPKGFSVGAKFNIGPISAIVNSANPGTKDYLRSFLLWGIGINTKYAITRDNKYLPAMSVGAGVQFGHTEFYISNIRVGGAYLDPSNESIPCALGFFLRNDNTSFYFDFAISKRISFFQPFASLRFVQTVSHNLTKIVVLLDLDEATPDAKNTYAEEIVVSNKTNIDSYGNEIGIVIPVTDFIINAGFEFIIKIFRIGAEASYGFVSKSALITLGMRFQVEDYQFNEFKKKK